MAQPIYVVFFVKWKEPYYKLTTEEQNKLGEQGDAALKQVGGERIVTCMSFWANEKWLGWGVEKYPDIEAVQKHSTALYELNWFNYFDSITYLGTEMPQT
jgi:hypothetical protein